MKRIRLIGGALALALATSAHSGITVDYTQDAGGNNENPLNGLAARATFDLVGTAMTVLLENTSTGAPDGFEVSDSLLVSIGFNLLDGVTIVSGESAAIGGGSGGLGAWDGLGEGDTVNEEWAWTNDGSGDLLDVFSHVISTSNGFGSGDHTRFDGVQNGNVNGPFGGIAAAPPLFEVPDSQRAVSNSILFSFTLSQTLNEAQLVMIANDSIVEYGSDAKYVTVPGPASFAILALACVTRRRRRQH